MANNYPIIDGEGFTKTFKTTETGGVHTVHHNIDSMPGLTDTELRSSAVPTIITGFPAPQLDAFARVRTSDPSNRFDLEFTYDKQPTLVDEVVGGSGSTATHSADSRDVTLAIGNTTNGTSHALYAHYDVPYTPGCSQLVDITGTLDGAGLGSGDAFFFVRSSVSGSVLESAYAQTDWDVPSLDMDWRNSQIFTLDFQSLKVGLIRFGFNRGGVPVTALSVANDNIRVSGYWQSPSLPPFWRIYTDATYTYMEMGYGDESNGIGIRYRIAKNASATMRAICVTVKSEGGDKLFDMPGENRSYPMVDARTVAATLIPVLSISAAATFPTAGSIANRGVYIPTEFDISTDNPILYKILYRPTLTGASFDDVDAVYSGMRYDTAATAVTGGICVSSGYIATDKNVVGARGGLLGRTIMALSRNAGSDILTIAAVRTTTTSAAVRASLQWKEIR
jgi:hypothetical protein